MTATGTILLADDEERILKTLGRALRAEGHRVIDAPNGRRVLDMLAREAVDVIVIDTLIPELTGVVLFRELSASTPES
jgi:DNA-binding response OmpR family regulator